MSVQEIAVLVALAGILITLVFSLVGTRRAAKDDARRGAADMTTVVVKLENIGNGISEIKSDLRNVRDDVTENRERIVAVEASAKQAHKRLDELYRGHSGKDGV